MPTDTTSASSRDARNFALRGVAWSLGLFGLVRLGWFEAHAVLPLTQLQARIAESAFGAPALPIQVTLACSGADAIALCAGAILAYPTRWRKRLAGAAGGIGLILALNMTRIGTLGRAAASPSWFDALHIYIWPALLTLAVAGYVFTWMRVADRRRGGAPTGTSLALASEQPVPEATRLAVPTLRHVEGRFVVWTAALLMLFTAASPLYLESAGVLAVAAFIARAAVSTLSLFGVHAFATGNMMWTTQGGFLITQECVFTPVIPVYLAAVFAYSSTWRRRVPALLAAVPLFAGLAVARLLVVALPAALVGSPLFLIHAFYQLLLAVIVVFLAALWRHGAGAMAWRRTLLGGVLGGVVVYLLGLPGTRALTAAFAAGPPLEDPQGAIALLPAFQVGLYVALSVAAFVVLKWRPFVTGLAVLALSQVAVLAALYFVVRHFSFTPHARDVRAWALTAPLLVVVAMVMYERPRR